jgi:hypothetical protein
MKVLIGKEKSATFQCLPANLIEGRSGAFDLSFKPYNEDELIVGIPTHDDGSTIPHQDLKLLPSLCVAKKLMPLDWRTGNRRCSMQAKDDGLFGERYTGDATCFLQAGSIRALGFLPAHRCGYSLNRAFCISWISSFLLRSEHSS